ncbi:uncharacterized protein LOC106472787 [Limulus polyphemus]|uniref:Uncharacterized protein LOC106472787 n=1 Tax=Limulus polyphemus TaxID=6850 RepID=A0ABM1BUH5_LIMPO|nr:uncharacterized protein LOC106472787 [Limulus polyphemus]
MDKSSKGFGWNDLNIPPTSTGPRDEKSSLKHIGVLFNLATPIALGYVYWKCQQEKTKLKTQHSEEVQAFKKHLESVASQQGYVKASTFVSTIDEALREEENKSKEMLEELHKVEHQIKSILDIRCSRINPWKTRERREKQERDILKNSLTGILAPLEMYDGLQHIFHYDHLHCGGGFHKNGQLYRVWIIHWRSLIIAHRDRAIKQQIEKLKATHG